MPDVLLDLLQKHFPQLTHRQQEQFAQLGNLYNIWNQRINLISKKDIQNLYVHHILHSLSIAKVLPFPPHATILDLGTGGGFPGIPLAILFPKASFTLIDGIAKKIKVVQAIAKAINLSNITAFPIRAENLQGSYHFITTRAVAKLDLIYQWSKKLMKKRPLRQLEGGLLCLKGGDVAQELASVPLHHTLYPISAFFPDPYFLDKKVVHLY